MYFDPREMDELKNPNQIISMFHQGTTRDARVSIILGNLAKSFSPRKTGKNQILAKYLGGFPNNCFIANLQINGTLYLIPCILHNYSKFFNVVKFHRKIPLDFISVIF